MHHRRFGTVEKLPSGKYRATYRGPDKKRHSAHKTFTYEMDAEIWLRGEQKLIEFDEWTPPKLRHQRNSLSVGGWVQEWLTIRSHGTGALEPSTLAAYTRNIEARILKVDGRAGRLRDLPLVKLTRGDIADWWDAVNHQFDTPTANYHAYKRLKTALSAAVERDLIPMNVCTVRIHRPKIARKDLPTREVMQHIVDQLDHSVPRVDGSMKLLAILTFFHGLRIGEAIGLRRCDIEHTNGQYLIHIRGTAYRTSDGMVRKDRPKTAAGARTIPVFAAFHNDIDWHLTHRVGDDPQAMIFTTATGEMVLDTSYRSILQRAKERAGYKDLRITPHYGRNWVITTLAEAGMPIPAIGDFLGQRDLRTITEVYMRATDDRRDAVLRSVNSALGGVE